MALLATSQALAQAGTGQTVTVNGTPIVERQDVDGFGGLNTVVGAGQVGISIGL